MNSPPLSFSFAIDPPPSMLSPYSNVPYEMLYCHMCKKQMCDAVSFENHLTDPIHLMRFPYIEERYRQTALMMRHELKIAEHLKAMELNQARRKIKERQSYCTTCDIKIDGPIDIHRKSEFHLHMSTFLLPQKVNQELDRIELDAMEAEGNEESINNVVEEDAPESTEPSLQGEEDVDTYILTPTSKESANETQYAIGLNEPQDEKDDKIFLIVSTSNDQDDLDETNNCQELNETQAAKTDLVTTVPTPNSMQSPYAPNGTNNMFYCHLCKKHVWDSFENHVANPTHEAIRECLEESYLRMEKHIRLQAEIAIAMGRNRQGESYYCDMCDIQFHGGIAAHRNTECHKQLKKFFHPTCAECNLEFETRIDYDTHLLSADHMTKIATKNGTNCEYFLQFTLQVINPEDMINDIGSSTNKRKREDDEEDDDETKNSKKLTPFAKEEDEVTYDSDKSILYMDESEDIGADVQICSNEDNDSRLASPA